VKIESFRRAFERFSAQDRLAAYDKEHALDVRWLCKKHHDEAERIFKSLLTEQPLLL